MASKCEGFVPENEMGVVALFCSEASSGGWVLTRMGTAFPDATFIYRGEPWQAEFEFRSANFVHHQHDVRYCDIIICWKDNWRNCPLPVIELSSDWKTKPFVKSKPSIIKTMATKLSRLHETPGNTDDNGINLMTEVLTGKICYRPSAHRTYRHLKLAKFFHENPGAGYSEAVAQLGMNNMMVSKYVSHLREMKVLSTEVVNGRFSVFTDEKFEEFING